MYKPSENSKANAVWFGVVDIFIILILAGFICSLFLIDKTGGGHEDDPDEELLVFSVEVQAPYNEALFLQEGDGEPIKLFLHGSDMPIGSLILGDDGYFYVECTLSSVRASEDMKGMWYLGDTILLTGTVLSVQSELADFSVKILSIPETALPGSVGTTDAATEGTEAPEEDDAASVEPADSSAADSAAGTVS